MAGFKVSEKPDGYRGIWPPATGFKVQSSPITKKMQQLAHNIHHASITLDQDARIWEDCVRKEGDAATWAEQSLEKYEDLQVLAHELADLVLTQAPAAFKMIEQLQVYCPNCHSGLGEVCRPNCAGTWVMKEKTDESAN
jgi:hypothetical protein